MPHRPIARLAVAAACVGVAVGLAWGRGVPGHASAAGSAAAAVRALRFEPVGEPEVEVEADHLLAWALERSRPGPAGRELALGEGGAVRYRVRWRGGGEAVVTASGVPWRLRRPLPTDPGPDLLPNAARDAAAAAMALLVPGAEQFRTIRAQSFREGERRWHRFRWSGGSGSLPPGWEREVEVEVAGATVVSLVRRVKPLGTDLGVVAGRAAELRRLGWVAVVALALVVAGIVLAGAEGLAFHERLAVFRGILTGVAVGVLEVAKGGGSVSALVLGVVTGAAVTVLPVWTTLPAGKPLVGVPLGVVGAALVAAAPAVVSGVGAFLPATAAVAMAVTPWHLAAGSLRVAIVEETLLRGALQGLTAPVFGFWGAAMLGVAVGSLLHPLPTVPLVAAVAVTGVLHGTMAVAARRGGVGAAVVARSVAEVLLQRSAFPVGLWWSVTAVVPVAAGALCWALRKEVS